MPWTERVNECVVAYDEARDAGKDPVEAESAAAAATEDRPALPLSIGFRRANFWPDTHPVRAWEASND